MTCIYHGSAASHGGSFLDNLTDPRASAREYEVVFGLSGNNPGGRPDLGLTMQADYYGNQAIVKGFSLVDGRVRSASRVHCHVVSVVYCIGSLRVFHHSMSYMWMAHLFLLM